MKQLTKGRVPEFFTKYILRNSPRHWDEIGPIRQELREHILMEQGNCCAYTEIRISESTNSHIDHYRTRNLFPQLTFDYHNMLVSCNSEEYGAKHKDKHIKCTEDYDDLVNPIKEVPSDFIEFAYTGEVLSVEGSVKGEKTISFFNLNAKALVERRKTMATCMLQMKDYLTEEEIVESIGEFETMVRQLYKDGSEQQ